MVHRKTGTVEGCDSWGIPLKDWSGKKFASVGRRQKAQGDVVPRWGRFYLPDKQSNKGDISERIQPFLKGVDFASPVQHAFRLVVLRRHTMKQHDFMSLNGNYSLRKFRELTTSRLGQ